MSLISLLNLQEMEKDAYEYLLKDGKKSSKEIADVLGISGESAYNMLKKLAALGLVNETEESGIKKFHVKPSEKLEHLINKKKEEIKNAQNDLDKLKKDFQ